MKYILLLLVLAVPFVALAQTRGIGVSPARIDAPEIPHTTALFVTNLSSDKELFEVTGVIANPGRFVLKRGETGRIIVNFDEAKEGVIRVSATRVSSEGLTTGTGIEIPYKVGEPSVRLHRILSPSCKTYCSAPTFAYSSFTQYCQYELLVLCTP